MSESSRDAERRRREAAANRMRAAGITPPPAKQRKISPTVYVAAVIGLAVVVGLGFFLLNRSGGGAGGTVTPSYAVAANAGVITMGNTSAPVTLDIYEDYLCPACKIFNDRDHDDITTALNEGKIAVRYHPLGFLNSLSSPPGYSTRAANAALCAAQAGIFPAYHDKLFAEQPAEGGPGLSDAQLVAFGTELGAPAGFERCVTTGPHAADIGAQTKKAISDPNLQTNGTFGTPTVAVGGKKIVIASAGWLADVTG
ncbi:MAG: DsbA family protein [Dehalococcoidia bacterium]